MEQNNSQIWKIIEYIASDVSGTSEVDVNILEKEILENFGVLPERLPSDNVLEFTNEDAVYSRLASYQRVSSRPRIIAVLLLQWLITWVKIIALLVVVVGIGAIYVIGQNRSLPNAIGLVLLWGGVVAFGIFLSFLCDNIQRNYHRFLYIFLLNGDLMFFANNDIKYQVSTAKRILKSQNSYESDLEQMSLSNDLMRLKVSKFDPDKIYKSKSIYVYMVCFSTLISRGQSIFDEEKTRKILINLTTRILAFEERSGFSYYFIGCQYLRLGAYKEARDYFVLAEASDRSQGNYRIMADSLRFYCDNAMLTSSST